MIKIRLKCFSQVKYALGKNEIIFELENGASTDDLEKIVRKKAEGKLNDVALSTALNKKYISKNTELEDSIKFIKSKFKKKMPKLLYGGSVSPKNINNLKMIKDLDGFLIGGASQNSKNFIDIVKKTYN